jgi:hypothetical protein
MLVTLMFAAAISIPVPGGLAALAQALSIDAPDRGRAVAEIIRVVYSNGRQRDLLAHFAVARPRATDDVVPLPLPLEVWRDAIFLRRVTVDDLFVAVLSDRSAALVAYGLASLDEETLAFFASHPALVAALYTRHAGAFSAFAGAVHIRGNRVVVPGGDAAIPQWEAQLKTKVSDAAAFVLALMSSPRGRMAYLYDVFAHIDAAKTVMTRDRFAALASVVSGLFSEWDVRRHPFTRPTNDVLAMFMRLQDPAADVAVLAKELLSEPLGRAERLDQFAFGQRVFGGGAHTPEAAAAIRALRDFPMLMLTLERIGVRRPATYTALARQAERIGTLAGGAGRTSLIQFQGAIAIVDRMRRVQTLDRAVAENLLDRLATTPTALWIDRDLRQALAVTASDRLEDAMLRALTGAPRRLPARVVPWEGGDYLLDPAVADGSRIRRFRQHHGGPTIDVALDLYRLAQSIDRTAAARVSSLSDTLLADALLSLAYAADWPDVGGTGRMIRNVARRHDFGFELPTEAARHRMAWTLPERTSVSGVGWRLEGALLGVDIGLAPLALRRVSAEVIGTPPAISSNERATFVESFALLDAAAFDDRTQSAIADAIARGERRVTALTETPGNVDALMREAGIEGHRAQALRWAVAHDADSVPSYFSLSELLDLGGGRNLNTDAWGTSARKLLGCLCRRSSTLVSADALVGRPHLGLMATRVADLHLRVAVTLHELGLPAALTKAVVAAAAQEFFDRVRPSDADDWLTLTRSAKGISRDRVEDYLAGAIGNGPLVPALNTRRQIEGARR